MSELQKSLMHDIHVEVLKEILEDINKEVLKASLKFPTWPSDPLHALAVLGEEFGELTQATLQTIYEPEKKGT